MIYLAPMEGVVDPVIREVLTGVGALIIAFLRITSGLLPDKILKREWT